MRIAALTHTKVPSASTAVYEFANERCATTLAVQNLPGFATILVVPFDQRER